MIRILAILVAGWAVLAAPVAAQDATDPPDTPESPAPEDPVSGDAATLLGERGKTPDQRSDPDPSPGFQQTDNAGRFEGTVSMPMTRSETTVTEESSTTVSVGSPTDDDKRDTSLPGFPAAGTLGWGSRGGWGSGGGWGGSGPSADQVKGEWNLRMADGGMSCTVRLGDDKWGDLYGAWTPSDCPKGFFDVARWGPGGGGIRMTDNMGRTIAEFRRAGENRYEGVRVSDGGRVLLTR